MDDVYGACATEKPWSVAASGPDIHNAILIEPNFLSEPEDMEAALAAVELCCELENDNALTPLVTG